MDCAEYPAHNIVELLRLLHCVMQNVHPRQLAGQAQGSKDAVEYDFSNKPFRKGQQRQWEPPGAPTLLLHFVGGGTGSMRDEGDGSEDISAGARGLLNCIQLLAEARSLRVVSKPVSRADEGQQHARGGRGATGKRQLYLAPRVRHLVMAAPTLGILLMSRPDLLQNHV